MFYTCNYNIRVTHRNGVLNLFFTRIRSTEGSSADCSLFILSLHALALHLAVKILLQIFLYRRFEHVNHIHLSVVFPPECQQNRTFVAQPMLFVKNISIQYLTWKQIINKTQEVRPIETVKAMCKLHSALVSHGRFYQWLRLPFLKKYSIKWKDLDCDCFILILKRHNVSHYIYYLTDNIHIVLKTLTPC